MIIQRIEAIPFRMPLVRPFPGSSYAYTHKEAIITRIYTDDGLVGESYNNDDYGIMAPVVGIIDNELAPLLVGQRADRIEACWERGFKVTKPILREHTLGLFALACVDCALWDLLGKSLDTPLYKLWGGYTEELPVLCIAGYYSEGAGPAHHAHEMEELRALGMAGCKFKVGGRTLEEDAARLAAAREGGGDDFILAADANQAWTRTQALEFTRRVEHLDIRWLEEPVRWDNDVTDLAELRKRVAVPICAGQSEHAPAGCRDLMTAGAIDICNPMVTCVGGVTPWRRIAGMAQSFGVQLAHTGDSQLAPHLMTATSAGFCIEVYHPDRDPLFYETVTPTSGFCDGRYRMPERAGWGLQIDPALVERYRVG